MRYLLDTNVVSEIFRRTPHENVARWLAERTDDDLYLSVLTFGELTKGIEMLRMRGLVEAEAMAERLKAIDTAFGDRVLPLGRKESDVWGRFAADRSRSVVDCLIAATAHSAGLTVATRNVKDFEDLPVLVVDPFDS